MADWTSLVVAVVGVVGTASVSITTQRYALKSQGLESQAKLKQVADDRAEALREMGITSKREMYTELNTKARNYRASILDCYAHMLHERADSKALGKLEEARVAFRECNARAQLIVPRRILDKARVANKALGDGYRAIHSESHQRRAEVEQEIGQAVRDLLDSMRIDLEVDQDPDSI